MTVETTQPAVEETAPPPAEAPRTTPLKLSEAIRLGAMMTEQAFATFGDRTKTCAIGAAQVALGLEPGHDDGLAEMLIETPSVALPCEHRRNANSIGSAVIHLNDDDRWPRERIATWLESLGL